MRKWIVVVEEDAVAIVEAASEEEANGEEAEDVAILLDRLGDDVPLGWLRVGDESDAWVPIVK